jgi:2,5-diketo-D-gluconate reductase A
MSVPTVTLNNAVTIPQLGFGVYQIPPESVEDATSLALDLGYRHIDTAAAYANEAGVGRALRRSGIPREELFVTTKLRNADQGYESTLAAFESSRAELGLEVIDLYLIHWPYPRHGLYVETWNALEQLYADGRVRAIGVSNFLPTHLDDILAGGTIVPSVNQIELHPSFQQKDVSAASSRHGMVVEAYSPLGQGSDLDSDTVLGLARKYGKTPAQVVLKWHMQSGYVAIPKSVTPQRVRENIDLFDFSLDPSELTAVDALESGLRSGGDPAVFDFPQK